MNDTEQEFFTDGGGNSREMKRYGHKTSITGGIVAAIVALFTTSVIFEMVMGPPPEPGVITPESMQAGAMALFISYAVGYLAYGYLRYDDPVPFYSKGVVSAIKIMSLSIIWVVSVLATLWLVARPGPLQYVGYVALVLLVFGTLVVAGSLYKENTPPYHGEVGDSDA